MTVQRVEATAHAQAPPDAVWRLLADPHSWTAWGPWDAVEVEREGRNEPGGVGAIKVIRAGRARIREEIIAFEQPRRLAYRLLDGIPVRGYEAEVSLTPDGEATRIEWRSSFSARWPGTGGLIRRRLEAVTEDVAARLARAAEAQRT